MDSQAPFPLPQMDPCYFCRILADPGPHWSLIARDAGTATLLNGRQFEIGQVVVVPLRHAPTLLDLEDRESAAVMAAARRVAAAMVESLSPEGILLYQNNGVASLQEVPHFHLHVVPRRAGSDWGEGPPHLARVHSGAARAKLDHSAVTEAKMDTIRRLRRVLDG